ncbi:hypothetical protein JD844_029096, partial [Phrynosoma platyrhinos]
MGQVVYFGLCLLGCLLFNSAVEATDQSPHSDKVIQNFPLTSPYEPSFFLSSSIAGTQNSSRLSSRSQCPPGVLYYNRFCYEFFSDPASWEDAEV